MTYLNTGSDGNRDGGRLRGQRSRHRFDDAIQLATWARELKPSLFRMLPT
jgi:hypothetical protein